MNFIPVKKTSRTGNNGRLLQCPHCGEIKRVYHFSWSALGCQGCDRMVEKYEYKMEAK